MSFNLTKEQAQVTAHIGAPYRLLAGPGTGKTATLVGRVVKLLEVHGVDPEAIHILTFTRAAAQELRNRIRQKLEDGNSGSPGVSTIHSYALSQLLKAGEGAVALPQPLRIADDWEKREIIRKELKHLCKFKHVKEVDDKFNLISSCWHKSADPKEEVEQGTEDAKFLGEWVRHREVYGYSMQDELVYQLKTALERKENLQLDAPAHLLVDEYQDLNRCDLDVILEFRKRGAEVFVSGDDDQSIYGFRHADPQGIRQFEKEYPGAGGGVLEVCHRCAPNILSLGEHVANLDPDRMQKNTRPLPDRKNGEVAFLWFDDQNDEARKIADICRTLLDNGVVEKAGDILILLRNNFRENYSKPIVARLKEVELSVASTDEEKPLDRESGRIFLSFMRLAVNAKDSLAWRTLFQIWCKGIGKEAFHAVYKCAVDSGRTFAEQIGRTQDLPQKFQGKIANAVAAINAKRSKLFPNGNQPFPTFDALIESVRQAAEMTIDDSDECEAVMAEFTRARDVIDKFSIGEIIVNASGANEEIEQGKGNEDDINIMTMHKAKGLTAKAVIIAGAENERIPGDAKGAKEKGEERRLLYVSLTRAKDILLVTYCHSRTGAQKYSGKNSGSGSRNLTEFLRHYRGCKLMSGEEYALPILASN